MKLKFGQYVHHAKYGWGTIVEPDGTRTMVYFRNVGIKKLATSSNTKLSKIDGRMPKPSKKGPNVRIAPS